MPQTLYLRGNFPLILFIEETQLKLPAAVRVVIEELGENLYITYVEQQPVYGFELCAYTVDTSGVQTIIIQSSGANIVFNTAWFNPDASLLVPGIDNTIEFSDCVISNLSINTTGRNALHFERQSMLNSVNANLSMTLLTGLKVRGRTTNKIDARNHSVVQISVCLAKDCKRTFSFNKDTTSMIAVTCSTRGSREVLEDRELWSISDMLDSIVPVDETADTTYDVNMMDCEQSDSGGGAAAAAQSQASRPTCAVCREASPEMLLIPCNHVCLCPHCAGAFHNRNIQLCPVCRASVEKVTRVYISCS